MRIYYESRVRPPFYNCTDATTSYEIMNNSINDCYVIDTESFSFFTLLTNDQILD